MYQLVRRWPTSQAATTFSRTEVDRLVSIMDHATALYFTGCRCLQYSAAAVCFLRSRGVPATCVLGVVARPFFAHAWVELGENVLVGVTDKRKFVVLDRF